MGIVRSRQRVRLPAPERREQLLVAATSLIAERGYWALSMQDVADSCDLSLPPSLARSLEFTGIP